MTEEQLFFISIYIPIVVAIVALGVQIFRPWYAARITRKQATLEFLNQYNNDDKVSLGHAALRRTKEQSPGDILSGEERDIILFLLNKLEILARNLECSIYDIKIIKSTFGSDICGIYNDSKRIIYYIRGQDDAIDDKAFEEFEKLAMKLMKKSAH